MEFPGLDYAIGAIRKVFIFAVSLPTNGMNYSESGVRLWLSEAW